MAPVYPRVGGGTTIADMCPMDGSGLSPRGRGNRSPTSQVWPKVRSIPAWAGEPWCSDAGMGIAKVYPRVGGGTIVQLAPTEVLRGLSPRGRGNPGCDYVDILKAGSIPAWAGEPSSPSASLQWSLVYPRVGGEPPRLQSRGAPIRVYPRVGGGTR